MCTIQNKTKDNKRNQLVTMIDVFELDLQLCEPFYLKKRKSKENLNLEG